MTASIRAVVMFKAPRGLINARETEVRRSAVNSRIVEEFLLFVLNSSVGRRAFEANSVWKDLLGL